LDPREVHLGEREEKLIAYKLAPVVAAALEASSFIKVGRVHDRVSCDSPAADELLLLGGVCEINIGVIRIR
jgi:hypothetical protein